MDNKREWRLYPLRIPTGWFVRWNTFCDVDPSALSEDERKLLSEDLLQLENRHFGVVLDMGWSWQMQAFGLTVIRSFTDDEKMKASWGAPLEELTTCSTHEAAETIEAWLRNYSDHAYVAAKLKRK